MCSNSGIPEENAGSLRLELQAAVVSHHVGAGSQTRVFWKSSERSSSVILPVSSTRPFLLREFLRTRSTVVNKSSPSRNHVQIRESLWTHEGDHVSTWWHGLTSGPGDGEKVQNSLGTSVRTRGLQSTELSWLESAHRRVSVRGFVTQLGQQNCRIKSLGCLGRASHILPG